jgi:hypothetical protein
MLVSPTGQLHAAHLLDQVVEHRVKHVHPRLKYPQFSGCHLRLPGEAEPPPGGPHRSYGVGL